MINLSELSLRELERLRSNIKMRMFHYPLYDSQYTNLRKQAEVVKNEINKRYGLYSKEAMEKARKLLGYEGEIIEKNKKPIETFGDEFKKKSKEEIDKGFEDFKQTTTKIDKSMMPDEYYKLISTTDGVKYLNVDKIQTLDDVKRVLKFLKITAVDNGVITTNGFEEVRDLFE